jgi:hypothetical protein
MIGFRRGRVSKILIARIGKTHMGKGQIFPKKNIVIISYIAISDIGG